MPKTEKRACICIKDMQPLTWRLTSDLKSIKPASALKFVSETPSVYHDTLPPATLLSSSLSFDVCECAIRKSLVWGATATCSTSELVRSHRGSVAASTQKKRKKNCKWFFFFLQEKGHEPPDTHTPCQCVILTIKAGKQTMRSVIISWWRFYLRAAEDSPQGFPTLSADNNQRFKGIFIDP